MSYWETYERPRAAEAAAAFLSGQRNGLAGSGSVFNTAMTACEVALDAVTSMTGVLCAVWLYHSLRLGKQLHYEWHVVLVAGFIFSCILVLLLDRLGAYRKGISLLRIRETERCLKASLTAILWCCPLTFLWGTLFSRWVFIIGMFMVPLLLICEKQLTCILVQGFYRRGYGLKRVLIYGAGYSGRRLLSAIARSPKLGLEPIALVDDNSEMAGQFVYASDYRRGTPLPVLPGPINKKILHEARANMVVVGIPSIGPDKLLDTLEQCAEAKLPCSFISGQALGSELLTEYIEVDGLTIHSLAQPGVRTAYDAAKRIFDLLAGTLTLVLISPILVFISILIKCDSRGSVLYKQRRIGKDGKSFTMFKYRTMFIESCGDDFSPRCQEDPRITRVGRFLRRTSLDELPQILNVLRGEMSLVGPRPEMPFIVAEYNLRERQRLQVKPGITCLWQLSADRSLLIHENMQYDLYYIRNRGFFLDVAILLHTIVFAMRGI